MKTLILFIFLSLQLFAQSSTLTLLFSDDGYKNAETRVYLASLTTPISKTYAATLDSFITKVKDSLSITSLSSKFDIMYDLGGETTEQSLKNLVKRSHDATAVNSPTWVQWQGFTGNGSTSYLNTNYNPNTQGVNYTLNDNSFGVYVRTNVDEVKADMGASDNTNWSTVYTRRSSTRIYGADNYIHNNDMNYNGISTSVGLTAIGRVNATQMQIWRNGIALTTSISQNSTGVPNTKFFILAFSANEGISSPSTKQVAFSYIGASMTATEHQKFFNCVEWLMDRKGTGVIP